MPWTCSACQVELGDSEPCCSSCGARKTAWTILNANTRTFVVTRARLEVLRAEGDDAAAPLAKASSARAVPRARARAWADEGRQPPASDVTVLRVTPGKSGARDVKLVVDYAQAESGEVVLPEPAGAPPGPIELRLLFVYGAGPTDGPSFPGLEVVDISEETQAGYAPGVVVQAVNKEKELEVEAAPGVEAAAAPAPERGSVLVRLEDLTFNLNSIVLLPDAREDAGAKQAHARITGLAAVRAILEHARQDPGKKLLVVGHTDTSGKADFNLTLSTKRAENVHAYLTGDRAAWAGACTGWSYKVDWKQVLAWTARTFGWDTDPGKIDEQQTPAASAARDRFRARYAAEYGRTIPAGDQNRGDWEAYFDLYDAHLARLLGVTPAELAARRAQLAPCEPPVLGCGEQWPRQDTGDGVAAEANRRVEVWMFDPDDVPALPGSPPGQPLYGEGSAYDPRHLTIEGEAPPGTVELLVVDFDHRPVPNASVTVRRQGVEQTFTTDARGIAFVPGEAGAEVGVAGHVLFPIHGAKEPPLDLLGTEPPPPEAKDERDDEPFDPRELVGFPIIVPGLMVLMVQLLGKDAAKVMVKPIEPEPVEPVADDDPEEPAEPAEPEEPEEPEEPAEPEDPGSGGSGSSTYGPSNPYRYANLGNTWDDDGVARPLQPAEFELKQKTYKAHVKKSAGKRSFVEKVPSGELANVPGSSHQMRTKAAAALGKLLAAARAARDVSGEGGAKNTVSIGINSAYRSARTQFTLWDSRFVQYMWGYRKDELGDLTVPPGDIDPEALASYIGGKTACPGYSNHNEGYAVDFLLKVKEGGKTVSYKAGNRSGWKTTWFWAWLCDHAGEYGFEPYSAEPWHWNYVG